MSAAGPAESGHTDYTAAEVAAALGNADLDTKGSWRCDCPSCGHHNLIVSKGRKHPVIVKCFNGCTQEALVGELRHRGLLGPKANGHDTAPVETEEERLAKIRREERETKNRTADALDIWDAAKPIANDGDTMTERYLGSREILLPVPDKLREAPILFRPKSHDRRPHIVALVEHEEKGPVGIHLIALYPIDPTVLATGKDRKWSQGPIKGGAVRLCPAGPVLALAEAIEDALVFTQESSIIPAWAAISANGIANFVPPPLETTQTIVLIEDQDKNGTGQRAVADAAQRLGALGYKIQICRPKPGNNPKTGKPIKDLNDALRAFGTGSPIFDITDYAPDALGSEQGNGAKLPGGYKRAKGGIWYQEPARGDGTAPEPLRICADFQIVAETSDETHYAHGLLLKWIDRGGHPHLWSMPRKLVHSDGNVIASELEDAGLHCETSRKAHEQLKHLLGAVRVDHRVRCVDRAGWHGKTYVLPDGRRFGADAQTVVMQSEHIATGSLYAPRGTPDEWQANIAGYAARNDLLLFHISAAFAAPLLEMTGEPSGGAHIDGASRVGKTTLLCSAASVWGPGELGVQIRPWRATANGLEAVAAETCDGLLLLDEIGQANPREVGEVIYMLANQTGKSRANRAGGPRRHKTWRVVYLSTGELSPAAKMAEAGLRLHAGQDVRLVTLSGDAGAGLGVFNDLHGMPSAAAMADHLRNAACSACGTAGPAFLDALTRDRAQDVDGLLSTIRTLRECFEREHLPDNANGQVRSVGGRFSLIAAAGELARRYGIVPWDEGEALRGVGACFTRWLSARGGPGAAEDMQALDAVRSFIAAHGSSRFEDTSSKPGDQRIFNRVGFKRRNDAGDWEYLVLCDPWRTEVCRGLDPKRVARVLADNGLLLGWTQRSMAALARVPGHGRLRAYCVSGTILEAEPSDGQ